MVNRETGGELLHANLYYRGMRTLGQRIKAAREQLKLSQEDLAKLVGVKQQTIGDLESGKSASTKFISRFAKALQQDIDWLEAAQGKMRPPSPVHESVTGDAKKAVPWLKNLVNVRVVGSVQAGVWAPALEWSSDDHKELPVIIDPRYKGLTLIGLEMIGPSMNKYYPSGSIAICASYIEMNAPPAHLDHVVVQHWRGEEVEATVKEFRIDEDGIQRLWPCSTHPDFQSPLKVARPPKGEEIRITHKVVQAVIIRP